MIDETLQLLKELQAKINIFSNESMLSIARIEKILTHIDSTISKLKEAVNNYIFNQTADEIRFYKEINPEFYAHWFYFSSVYSIQCHVFPASSKQRMKYYEHELEKIDDFFYHHIDFYKYYQTGKTYRDVEYFTRQPDQMDFNADPFSAIMDRHLCTPHSLKIATMLANERLKNYISEAVAMEKNTQHQSIREYHRPTMQWTAPKTGLVELIYACYAGKVFNNGNATIESITRFCEDILGIELSAQTVTFQEILRRKKGPTTFMDWLKTQYTSYIDAIDEKHRLKNRK